MSSTNADPQPSRPEADANESAGRAPVIPIRPAAASDPAALGADVEAACRRIPPLWTLRNFVAVNPFLGLADRSFAEAAGDVERLFHGRALMPLAFYREQHARGRIREADLYDAIAEAPADLSQPEIGWIEPEVLLKELYESVETEHDASPRVETVADALDRRDGSAWSRLVVHEISKWCAARFDAGQAAWGQPWRDLPPYAAWKAAARIDRSPEIAGLGGFRAYVDALPDEPLAAIDAVLAQLAVPAADRADLLTRQLSSIAGWAGHLQLRVREAGMAGREDDALVHLLAIRLAFDGALERAFGRGGLRLPSAAKGAEEPVLGALALRAIWQRAYELGYRGQLLAGLSSAEPSAASGTRPKLQAVFCIDVRSEVLRRHLEAQSDEVRTIGFAGFFGFPIELVKPGEKEGTARCPVLLSPGFRLRERGPIGSDAETRSGRARVRHERFSGLRKLSVGAFPLVETLGHFFGVRLLTDSLGWTRPHEGGALFPNRAETELAPSIEAEDGLGLSLEARVDLAEGALRNMGLTRDFAEVVLLCGHGSLSTNNPYASGLDCGACGGHRGDANARIAAAVLGSPAVRRGLAERGIHVPDDTVFVAGLHDTTRDTVELFDEGALEPAAKGRIAAWLEAACEATRDERAERLGEGAGRDLGARLQRRSQDWSEMRPEWGLAGNAAFVAARRDHTRGLRLGGRTFLHDYDAAADPEGQVLELILTAPLVVASWINLQYYASTTDNEVFGSGDKTLHNVVGRHGVMLGNRSDLQVGLPWQSVHDGQDFVHEPMRLTAIVEAPRARIDAILAAHPDLRETIANGWIHLVAWDTAGGRFHRLVGEGWEEIEAD